MLIRRRRWTTGDTLPFKRITEDGMADLGKGFWSFVFSFGDVPFATASIKEQKRIFAAYGDLLNSLDIETSLQVVIADLPVRDMAEVFKKIACRPGKDIPKEVLPDLPDPGLFNEGLMELGELLCTSNGRPLCRNCPWKESCLGLKNGLEADLPLRGAPKPRRIEKKTVLLLCCRGKTALEKRPDKGLLAGLYGFPVLDGWLEKADVRAFLASYGAGRVPIEEAGGAVHIFTHVEWHMKAFRAETERPLPDFVYAGAEELKTRYALPSAFKYFVR